MKRSTLALAVALSLAAPADARHYRHRDMRACQPWVENGRFTHRYWYCRNPLVHRAFLEATGHPHGWPGHIADHTLALDCGGADDLSNLQWQTVSDAHTKDLTETQGCYEGHQQ